MNMTKYKRVSRRRAHNPMDKNMSFTEEKRETLIEKSKPINVEQEVMGEDHTQGWRALGFLRQLTTTSRLSPESSKIYVKLRAPLEPKSCKTYHVKSMFRPSFESRPSINKVLTLSFD